MASEAPNPARDPTPTPAPRTITPVPLPSYAAQIPQKRALEDEASTPPVPSPLNPDAAARSTPKPAEEMAPSMRDKPARTKKETLKKREAKGALGGGGADSSSRATPDPKQPGGQPGGQQREVPASESGPLRYKLAPPKQADFEPSRGPSFAHHHDVVAPDGRTVEFYETMEQ